MNSSAKKHAWAPRNALVNLRQAEERIRVLGILKRDLSPVAREAHESPSILLYKEKPQIERFLKPFGLAISGHTIDKSFLRTRLAVWFRPNALGLREIEASYPAHL